MVGVAPGAEHHGTEAQWADPDSGPAEGAIVHPPNVASRTGASWPPTDRPRRGQVSRGQRRCAVVSPVTRPSHRRGGAREEQRGHGDGRAPASLEVAFGVPTAQRRSAVALRLLLASPAPRRHRTQPRPAGDCALGWLGRSPPEGSRASGATMRPATCAGHARRRLRRAPPRDYPPFSMNATHRHPVRLAFPTGPDCLAPQSSSVLVLVLPAALLATLSELGIMVAAFFIWWWCWCRANA